MGIIIHIKLLHLRDITLPDGSFLINQRLEHIVLMFNQLTISQMATSISLLILFCIIIQI